jgi:hypothetical protein
MRYSTALSFAIALLCTGCVGPFRGPKSCEPCAATIDDPAAGASAAGEHIEDPRHHNGILRRTGGAIVHTTCLPYTCCCHVLNFCATDKCAGPPEVPGPGRFHPVPSHPVFAPAAEPLAYLAESHPSR